MDDMRIEYLPIDALTPYERNARAHGEDDIVWAKQLRSSLGHGNKAINFECLYTNR